MESALDEARTAFVNQEWRRACDIYAVALAQRQLTAADFERWATAAHLVGEDAASDKAWEDAARTALEGGDRCTAARCAFWHGLSLLLRGQHAKAGGWLSRAGTLVDEAAPEECSAAGLLLIPRLLGVLKDDPAAARDLALRAIELGTRRKDDDLRALGMLGQGQALIAMGDIEAGVARLDEVMVSVTGGEVGPLPTGIVYCAVILECMALFDLARAAEWTEALGEWCDRQPDLLPFRGQCLVHRSQLQQTAGAWSDAAATADAACDRLSNPPHPALGLARYQCGELRRLLGDFAGAEAAYREASRLGQDPMPGLALLELMRGDTASATSSIRRALHDTITATARPLLLTAAVEILKADGDIVAARAAVDELNALATSSPAAVLKAMAAHSTGSVLVAEGDPAAALAPLRTATRKWQVLRMPYEGARTAVVVGLACAALGDGKTADLEFANAREVFDRLGALPDLRRVETLATPSARFKGLTEREREVLVHLAAGKTNDEIAGDLVLSRHTVRRHVEHIFTKLGVSTRAAATAYAHQHGLLSPLE